MINFNGDLYPEGQNLPDLTSPGLRSGDGLFETMKILDGRICLQEFHFERLLAGLKLLQFETGSAITTAGLSMQVLELCNENQCSSEARIRMTFFRREKGSKNAQLPDYLIECRPLAPSLAIDPPDGLQIDIFPDGRKSMDAFSNLKSNNYLIYAMAGRYAKSKGFDECLILNARDRICDAGISNVFALIGKKIFTPALSEGGIAGVMRRFILENIHQQGYEPREIEMDEQWVMGADEIFLTNAIRGIRPVKKFRGKTFPIQKSQELKRWLNNFFPHPQLSGQEPV